MSGPEGESVGVVAKTCAILREIARSGQSGARMSDITLQTGISRPSAHRILTALKQEGFVSQSGERRYQLSSVMGELCLSAPSPARNVELLRPTIQELSEICGDTVYLSMRVGDNAHYLMRCEGAYPIKTYVVEPHQSLRLVSCHSGRALLAALPDAEVEAIIDRAWKEDPKLFHSSDPETLRDEIESVRRNGFGWARDVTFPGVAGMTRAVSNPAGAAYMAVTISSISQRLTLERAGALAPSLAQATAKIRSLLDERRD
jgi:DNA-binding IclR family transcriptional regulator